MAKLFVVVGIVAFFGYFCWFSAAVVAVVVVVVVVGNYSMSFALALLWLLATRTEKGRRQRGQVASGR